MKCKFKSILALAIALMMCVTMLPTAAFAATTETVSIGTAKEYVDFVTEFNAGQHKGANVVLTDDIRLDGQEIKPIGGWGNTFTGTFDGGNHTISDASITGDESMLLIGLIGYVNGGTVKNLNTKNVSVIGKSSASGDEPDQAAVGVVAGTAKNATFFEVHVGEGCSATGLIRVGGIVGGIRNTTSITHCSNAATVTNSGLYTGGIVGAAHNLNTYSQAVGATISDCKNFGIINGTTNVGGIVGYADRSDVDKCINQGKVTGDGNYGTGGIMGCNAYNPPSRVFPLIGWVNPTTTSTIDECKNGGDVVGGRAGGILGAYIVAPGRKQPDTDLVCTITACENTGNVTGTTGKIGSIFGYQISYASGDGEGSVSHLIVKIINCTYSGNATSSPYVQIIPAT